MSSDGGHRSFAPSSPASRGPVEASREGDLHLRRVDRGSHRETWVSGRLPAATPEAPTILRELIAGGLGPEHGRLGRLRLFGATAEQAARLGERLPGLPVDLYLSPRPGTLPGFGVEALVIEAAEGSRLSTRPLPEGGEAWLLEAGPLRLAYGFRIASPEEETLPAYRASYAGAFEAMAGLGFAPSDVARTWCFFRDVLEDYGGFNAVRRDCFEALGLLGAERIPASTGIQSILSSGEHLCLDALAVSGPGLTLSQVENPEQCEATDYGSLFSRAIRVDGLGPTMLLVSGMAAIDDAEGLTLHLGDAPAQLRCTVEKATALLESGGSSWARVVTGVVYLKPGQEALLEDPLLRRLLHEHPLALSLADVCRDDLLVEIELLAA